LLEPFPPPEALNIEHALIERLDLDTLLEQHQLDDNQQNGLQEQTERVACGEPEVESEDVGD